MKKEGRWRKQFRVSFKKKKVEGIDKPHVGLLPVSRGRNETLTENCRLEVLGLFFLSLKTGCQTWILHHKQSQTVHTHKQKDTQLLLVNGRRIKPSLNDSRTVWNRCSFEFIVDKKTKAQILTTCQSVDWRLLS